VKPGSISLTIRVIILNRELGIILDDQKLNPKTVQVRIIIFNDLELRVRHPQEG
jgi:hypothetical protein